MVGNLNGEYSISKEVKRVTEILLKSTEKYDMRTGGGCKVKKSDKDMRVYREGELLGGVIGGRCVWNSKHVYSYGEVRAVNALWEGMERRERLVGKRGEVWIDTRI